MANKITSNTIKCNCSDTARFFFQKTRKISDKRDLPARNFTTCSRHNNTESVIWGTWLIPELIPLTHLWLASHGAAPARSTKRFLWALAPPLAVKMPHAGEGAAFAGKITRIKSPGRWFVKVLPALMSLVISNTLFPWDGQPQGKFPALLKMIHQQLHYQHIWEPALGCVCSYLSAWTSSSDTEGNITFMERWEWKIFFPHFEQGSLNLNTLMHHQTISQCTHLSQQISQI